MTRVSYKTADGILREYEVPAHVTMDGECSWRYLCGHLETGTVPCLLAYIQNLKIASRLFCPACRKEAHGDAAGADDRGGAGRDRGPALPLVEHP